VTVEEKKHKPETKELIRIKGRPAMSYRDSLGKGEKSVWDEACVLFNELLDFLHSQDMLRKTTIPMDRQRLMLIWENSRNYGIAFNAMVKKFENEKSILEFTSKADLTQHEATYIFISQLVGIALINIESVFKTSLLFFLEEKNGITRNMTLGRLLRTIEDMSSSLGQRLKAIVDTEIRNSLAHGTFWFGNGGKVFLATNSYLEDVKEMPLHKFWMEIKNMNTISLAFTEVLAAKIDAGYFKN
jgi:hypothetical protein